jgi:hypothetical protein
MSPVAWLPGILFIKSSFLGFQEELGFEEEE